MSYKLPPGQYAGYLRKSRVDLEAEKNGEEDTYARHERIFLDLCKRYGITISKIYRELPGTSGERISERPEMMSLLGDVEDNMWTGIVVVELERLARGDTMDQGIVAQAFKYSNTLIVTPMRTYNPNDQSDEEYFEFGLFMSRREFKTITRRLQSGRLDGVETGRYLGNIAPYGYQRVKLPGKGYTLEPQPDQAPIVQLIFSLYTDPDPEKRMGSVNIAKYLNDTLKVPTLKGGPWSVSSVVQLLRNPTYTGKVRWKTRPVVKKRTSSSRPRATAETALVRNGLHEGLISEDAFNLAQEIMNRKTPHAVTRSGKITNPLAGLVRCGMCGGPIVSRPYKKSGQKTQLICPNTNCKNVSSYLDLVELKLIQALKQWLEEYKFKVENRPKENKKENMRLQAYREALKNADKRLNETEKQLSQLHDLLEQGIYTIEKFMERSKVLEARAAEMREAKGIAEKGIEAEEQREIAQVQTIPTMTHVLSVYDEESDPARKNELLRTVLDKVVYTKEKGGRWSGVSDQFTLEISPKIPGGK